MKNYSSTPNYPPECSHLPPFLTSQGFNLQMELDLRFPTFNIPTFVPYFHLLQRGLFVFKPCTLHLKWGGTDFLFHSAQSSCLTTSTRSGSQHTYRMAELASLAPSNATFSPSPTPQRHNSHSGERLNTTLLAQL